MFLLSSSFEGQKILKVRASLIVYLLEPKNVLKVTMFLASVIFWNVRTFKVSIPVFFLNYEAEKLSELSGFSFLLSEAEQPYKIKLFTCFFVFLSTAARSGMCARGRLAPERAAIYRNNNKQQEQHLLYKAFYFQIVKTRKKCIFQFQKLESQERTYF